jgi:hypothetical protein
MKKVVTNFVCSDKVVTNFVCRDKVVVSLENNSEQKNKRGQHFGEQTKEKPTTFN